MAEIQLPFTLKSKTKSVFSDENRSQAPPTETSLHHQQQQQEQEQHFQQQQHQKIQHEKISHNLNNKSQQFCLRWNNYQSNLTSVFDQLLQNECFVDVTLACDGHSIKAHKIVLSACSPYFQSLFFDNPCQHPIIVLRDVHWPELKSAVEFMYKGEINVSQDEIEPLLQIAKMLKIRGLADVNGEQEKDIKLKTSGQPTNVSSNTISQGQSVRGGIENFAGSPSVSHHNSSASFQSATNDLDIVVTANTVTSAAAAIHSGLHDINCELVADTHNQRHRKRHYPSTKKYIKRAESIEEEKLEAFMSHSSDQWPGSSVPLHPTTLTPIAPFLKSAPIETIGLTALANTQTHDDEIKPIIPELINDEEMAKLMENSQPWLGASTSASIADSYQYQLQSMWQKCWITNQKMNSPVRFRERGPLKTWRPESMAEAILSVLKDGLSLSQAARKYDIPYPTFVLYSNRVHNMLGPSIEGGADLRPKGRGRPQRILLGAWPDDLIKTVVRTVVFRDGKEFKEEGMHQSLGRHSPVYPFPD